jgi:hypothetical protein
MSTQGLFWKGNIAHTQFKLLGTWKSAIAFAFPCERIIHPNFKDSPCAWTQNDLIEFVAKTRQEFLGHPHRSELPLALGAVVNNHAGGFGLQVYSSEKWISGILPVPIKYFIQNPADSFRSASFQLVHKTL